MVKNTTRFSHSAISRVIGIATLLILIPLYVISLKTPVHPDEAVFIGVGEKMISGALLYQDVFDHKPPGIHLVSWILNHLSDQIFVYRLAQYLVILSTAAIIAQISSQGRGSPYISAVSFLFLVPLYQGLYFLTEMWMVFFTCLSILCLIKITDVKQSKWAFVSGASTTLALIFKQPAGVIMLAQIIWLYAHFKQKFHYLKLYLAGITVIALPLIAYFSYRGVLIDAFNATVKYNLTQYPPQRFSHTLGSIPMVLGIGGVIIVVGIGSLASGRHNPFHSLLLLTALFLLPFCLYRPYHHYWIMLLPIASIGISLPWKEKDSLYQASVITTIVGAVTSFFLTTLIQIYKL
jgi:4-amino-4-deoxy-L-arabinose transferase-like glycosyltransferase